MADGLITPYLDIPFQHAAPSVLKAMKRPAKVVEYVPAHCAQTGCGFVYWPPAAEMQPAPPRRNASRRNVSLPGKTSNPGKDLSSASVFFQSPELSLRPTTTPGNARATSGTAGPPGATSSTTGKARV